jgi:hypothetical protein
LFVGVGGVFKDTPNGSEIKTKKIKVMARIKPHVKAIADAHLEARLTGKWDNPQVTSKAEVLSALNDGKTFEEVFNQVEIRFASVGSIIMNRTLDYTSSSYRSAIYKGFKSLLQ